MDEGVAGSGRAAKHRKVFINSLFYQFCFSEFLCRLKDLILQYGTPDMMPKNRDKAKKVEFVIAVVDLLRSKYGNDYQQVATLLQAESKSATKKKGFGG